MKTLEELKDEIAKNYGDDSWESAMVRYDYGSGLSKLFSVNDLIDLVAKLYANQKLDEVAEGQKPQICVELTKQSILSFKDEI